MAILLETLWSVENTFDHKGRLGMGGAALNLFIAWYLSHSLDLCLFVYCKSVLYAHTSLKSVIGCQIKRLRQSEGFTRMCLRSPTNEVQIQL